MILFLLLYLLQDNNILVNLKVKKYNKVICQSKKLDFLKYIKAQILSHISRALDLRR